MATTVTESQGVKLVTEVVSQTDSRAAQLASVVPQPTSAQVKGFRKAQPKALGSIQIMSGFTHISFGIALVIIQSSTPALTVASGVYFWIGFLLVSSGSVLVEAQRREGMWLVKVCCIISSIVIVATLMAVIIHGVEIGQAIPWCDTFKNDDGTVMRCSKSAYILSHGLNSMFILLCLLELCTAVTALVYGYKAMKQQDYTQMVL
ncbi:membrane-spanning 4-domains subfamily A member 4A-like isoform X1 [Pelodiscus sinensis]|uniref:membrane-spanning 4-domains subfamily A member 4A-like isoform X1 n=1 Tax=Pelodiscus sinensis TaxID=13735 RepID=UPI0003C4B151|nr:membrane-spanning 4-domains subfamily A member 15-like [Pelodiscus sinensis]|eukprot:XP_006111811.1 membrane-spanning 4-domains subfamily A member 15-like [Pelodiscus sinensis]